MSREKQKKVASGGRGEGNLKIKEGQFDTAWAMESQFWHHLGLPQATSTVVRTSVHALEKLKGENRKGDEKENKRFARRRWNPGHRTTLAGTNPADPANFSPVT